MSAAAITMREVQFRRSEGFALNVPELCIEPGTKLACVGPSGSGKSTLLNLLAGILMPCSGSIEVAGLRLDESSEAELRRFRLEQVGFVFQEFELLEHLTVLDNVLLRWSLGSSGSLGKQRDRLRRPAEALGIAHLLNRKPGSLSQGERQRVAICQALVGRPGLVLADEPTGNLDPEATRAALDLMLEEVTGLGATLVFVTHDHGLLADFDGVLDVTQWVASE